jgi:hypothetical protein
MSKLTTEKFLKKQKGVSVYWWNEGQPTVTGTPKQPSVLFQPQTQSNNLPVFDPNKDLPDNFDKINPDLGTQKPEDLSHEELKSVVNTMQAQIDTLRGQLEVSQ